MSATKRRAKAIQRREWIYDLDVRWAFRLDRFPAHAIAASGCSCGRKAWLMPGATPEDIDAHHQAESDHAYMHDLED